MSLATFFPSENSASTTSALSIRNPLCSVALSVSPLTRWGSTEFRKRSRRPPVLSKLGPRRNELIFSILEFQSDITRGGFSSFKEQKILSSCPRARFYPHVTSLIRQTRRSIRARRRKVIMARPTTGPRHERIEASFNKFCSILRG